MARDQHETVIDGHRYQMTMLGATQGYQLFHRLFRMVGPSLGAVMDATKSTGSIGDLDLSSNVVVDGIRALTENVKQSDLDHVIGELKKVCHVGVDGTSKTVPLSGVFEAHFSGEVGRLFKWLAWALKVQFGSFWSAFGDLTMQDADGGTPEASSPNR